MNLIKRLYDKSNKFALIEKKQKQFCWLLIIALVMFLIYELIFQQINSSHFVICGIIIVILIVGVFLYPKLVYFPLLIWMFLGQILGEFTSGLVLGIVYFVLFFPITFLIRIFKNDKPKKGWLKHNGKVSDYKKMY